MIPHVWRSFNACVHSILRGLAARVAPAWAHAEEEIIVGYVRFERDNLVI